MPPENVRFPASPRIKNYIKNTLHKCYDPPPKPSAILEYKTRKNGYRRFYLDKDTGLYRGWWKNNMRDGLGTLVDKKTSMFYEGLFQGDKLNGYGVISYQKPNKIQLLQYEGDFANGFPNGKGELHTDTYHYKGSVIDGKASGVGVAWFDDGTIYFGSWYDGKRMGEGMLVHPNKDRYEGNWYADKKHGPGQFCFFDLGQALEGIWVTDVCIRGTIRNIKYRQAAITPVKYAIPALKLKDWASYYYVWEEEAFAKVGKYVREDVGIKEILKQQSSETNSNSDNKITSEQSKEDHYSSKIIFRNSQTKTSYKFPSDITHIQPCVTFD